MREEDRYKVSPDENIDFQEKGIDFLVENRAGGLDEKGKRIGSSGFQELTLSYLCESSKLGLPENDISGKNFLNSLEKLSSCFKGKEIQGQIEGGGGIWVERDFLQLNENRGGLSKREAENGETVVENREKKTKLESLDLSLALPQVSQFNTGSNRLQNRDFPSGLGPIRSVQSVGPSFNNAQTTYSLSCSYSHPVSHNQSCSLTMNSTENNEYSMGSHRREGDQIWNCGEGTNGSVHSRFRSIGDGTVALSNHGGDGGLGMGNRGGFNKDSLNNSFYRMKSLENLSFYPSELPARPRMDGQSGDGLENLRDSDNLVVGKERKGSRPEKILPERILMEIVSDSIPVMAQIIQELTDETLESTKEYLKNVIANPERIDELAGLQKRLERRSDLSKETLSKCQKSHLEILVAIKMGLGSFLNRRNRLLTSELVDIFLLERCRNINCKRLLPVDDCDCKICSTKKGFCSECMCPVCLNFDCANNTCSWVGCDVCSHWCHAACGLQRSIIKPGHSLKGLLEKTEMQFYCLGCDHTSEMFGFIKEVFVSCAKDWSVGTLIKELDCVSKIFQESEDRKGKELHFAANEMLSKLENKALGPSDVCNLMFQFFDYANGLSDLGISLVPTKASNGQLAFERAASSYPLSNSLSPRTPFYNTNASSGQHELTPIDPCKNLIIQDEWSVKPVKKGGADNLENLVRMKEAEARMFQNRADEALGEVESLRQIMRIKTKKMEEESASQLAKLRLQETEERKRKNVGELKELESSHCDYCKMKIRMQSEISGLLKRMEATKQQLV